MSDKLTEIMAWKRREIAPLLRPVSETELVLLSASRTPSLAAALRRPDGKLAIIAEIKRRSPSAGDIKAGAYLGYLVGSYYLTSHGYEDAADASATPTP